MDLRRTWLVFWGVTLIQSISSQQLTNTTLHEDITNKTSSLGSLNRTLPRFDIIVRAYEGSQIEVHNFILHSFGLFWDVKMFNASIVVVLDEVERNKPFVNSFRSHPLYAQGSLRVEFERDPENVSYTFPGRMRGAGYDRQQRSFFYCDKYSHADVIGFMDSDAVFITPVVPEDLFEDGKPVNIGIHRRSMMSTYGNGSRDILGGLEPPGHFMINFPVLVKRPHFAAFREYVQRTHNSKSFDEVFGAVLHRHKEYCQFDWMMHYLWHYHHDDYSWHIQIPDGDDLRQENSTFSPLKSDGRVIRVNSVNTPIARVTIHVSYKARWSHEYFRGLFRDGVCYSNPSKCPGTKYKSPWQHTRLMIFEDAKFEWKPSRDALIKHYKNVQASGHKLTMGNIDGIVRNYVNFFVLRAH